MMGRILQKTVTKPLPKASTLFVKDGKQWARWKNRHGRIQTAPLMMEREDRIVITAKTYTAKYRDGEGIIREIPTGCRDAVAARKVLSDLEKRAENVKSGIRTSGEDAVIDHQTIPVSEHFTAFQAYRTAKGNNRCRIDDDEHRFERIVTACKFSQLSDLRGEALASWLSNQATAGMSAGTRNEYRKVMVGFGNWCVKNDRLLANPFANVPMADSKSDQRRKRTILDGSRIAETIGRGPAPAVGRRPYDSARQTQGRACGQGATRSAGTTEVSRP
jgi:hypothetical protein